MRVKATASGLLNLILLMRLSAGTSECPNNWFDCGNGKCIAKMWLCDEDNDCGNLKDEENCEGRVHPEKCLSNQFQCRKNGHCVPEAWRCDGEHDCDDSSDEKDCDNPSACSGYSCKDNHCIPNKWRCDGQEDCPDGSDEVECPNAKKCPESQFMCGSGSCLNLTQVCDGTKDCPDASDEGSHCGDSCANATCSQRCRSTPKGPECFCEYGYQLKKDNRTCLDIDECLEDGFCSHNCTNTPGGYSCSCLLGYQLVNKSCQAEGPEPLLVFSTLQEIRGIHLRSKRYFLIQKAIYKAAAVDADPTDQRLYWVEISNRSSVYSTKLDGSEWTTILSSGLQIPEDIAMDYTGRNLYITDSGLKQVLVCKIDGSVCHVLHSSNVEKPRSLKLDPPKGILYWSDWGDKTVGIYQSGMDGSNRVALVSTNIFWPNGIAVDHTTNRLFWTDARLHSIESITLNGRDRKTIINDNVHHPYSLTVFEDNLYWTDWNTFSLESCNKFTGHKTTLMVRENGKHIMGVHVYHPVLAPAVTNPCWSHTCSHMCVLAPRETYRCVCPSGYKLSNDNRTCSMGNRFPSLFVTEDSRIFHVRQEMVGSGAISVLPVTRITSIGKVEFDWKSRTLFIVDLSRPSIEYFNMTSLIEGTLLENHLILPEDLAFDWMSDVLYWVDSGKGSVEVISIRNRNMSSIVTDLVKPTAIALAPSRGIMFVSTIDNSEVAMYDMDGKNRKLLHRVSGSVISMALHPVKSLLYWADVTLEKIFSIDYLVPLSEIKTERNRAGSVISVAVSEKYLYWTDTKNRQLQLKQENSSYVHILPLPGIGNANAARKITYTRVPDQLKPSVCAVANGGCSHICLSAPNGKSCVCPLGMQISGDNVTCQSKECGKEDFRCKKSQVCIPNKYYCDGSIDCNDGSDEHCGDLSSRCVGNDFKCRNGRCILQEWKCDHRDDCGDNSDETDCPVQTSCGKNEFSCGGGECITTLWRCDGEKDCGDSSDEADCHETSCDPETQFRCDHGQCVPRSWVCDGAPDCYDGTDERNCTIKQKTCEATQFRCDDGTCIDKILVCDSRNDCQDGSDERNCSNVHHACADGNFQCRDGKCIHPHKVCDFFRDCSEGEEELNCTLRPCVKGEFQCPSKHCIPSRYVCDGDNDCLDGADENPNHCSISHKSLVPPNPEECNEFYCYVSKTCIPWSQVCDGRRDCEDLPDEGGLCSRPCSNHHGCAQLCRRTPHGPRCDCNSGFILTADEKTCVDLNECLIPGRCSHFCNNTKGGFKCSCAEGYVLERDHRKCKADGGSATLVYMLEDEIRGIDLGSLSQRVYLSHEPYEWNMKGIDFDADEDVFFWSDWNKGAINSYNLNTRKKLELIRDDRKPTYIRRDWITKNIYYPDEDGAIKVCNKDGSFCATLLENIAIHINSFTISPPNGLMFWSVWGAVRRKEYGIIERANLDGSKRVSIVFERIVSPNAVTVDEILKLIFWTDSKLNTLEYSDFHGLQRKVVFSGDMFYPYSMAIFEDFAFWADWGTDTIFKCDKFTGKDCLEFHKGNIRADDMMVVHKMKQPKRENRCENKCPHLCLLTQSSYTCKCGHSYIMRNSSCVIQPTPKTTQMPKMSCPESYCEQNARCVAVGGEFSCWCPDGFDGDRCEIKIAGRGKSYDYSWVVLVVFSILIITSIVLLYLLCKKDKEKIYKVTESVAVRFRNPFFGRKKGRLVLDEDGDSACDELVIVTKGYYKISEFANFLPNPLLGEKPHERLPESASTNGDAQKWWSPHLSETSLGHHENKKDCKRRLEKASLALKKSYSILSFLKNFRH